MRKDVIKSLIAIKQSEIPFDVIERDVKLPINRKKDHHGSGSATLRQVYINGNNHQ